MTKHFSKILVGLMVLGSGYNAPRLSDLDQAAMNRMLGVGEPAGMVYNPAGERDQRNNERQPTGGTSRMDGFGTDTEELSTIGKEVELAPEELEELEEPEELEENFTSILSPLDDKYTPEVARKICSKKHFAPTPETQRTQRTKIRLKFYGNLNLIVDLIKTPKGLTTNKNLNLNDKKKKALMQKKMLEQAIKEAFMEQLAQDKKAQVKRPIKRRVIAKKIELPS